MVSRFFIVLLLSSPGIARADLHRSARFERQLVRLMENYRSASADLEVQKQEAMYRSNVSPKLLTAESRISEIRKDARSVVKEIILDASLVKQAGYSELKNTLMHAGAFGGGSLLATALASMAASQAAVAIITAGVLGSVGLSKWGMKMNRLLSHSSAACEHLREVDERLKNAGVDLKALDAEFSSAARDILESPSVFQEGNSRIKPDVLRQACSYLLSSN